MTEQAAPELVAAPKRLTLSHIVEMLLTRSAGERSSVSITRNASGATQLEVSVRTGDDGDVVTVEDAKRKAIEVYEQLVAQYPASNGNENAEVALTRNAKGDTQIVVTAKTSDGSKFTTLDEVAAGAIEVYETTRAKYPASDESVGRGGQA